MDNEQQDDTRKKGRRKGLLSRIVTVPQQSYIIHHTF